MSVYPLFAPDGVPDEDRPGTTEQSDAPGGWRRSDVDRDVARVLRALDASIPRLRNAVDRQEVTAWVAASNDPVCALGTVALWAASADLRERAARRSPRRASLLPSATFRPGGVAAQDYRVVPFAGGLVRHSGSQPAAADVAPAVSVVPSTETIRRLRIARAALWARNIGAVILLFVVYQLWGTGFQQNNAQAKLRAETARLSQAAAPSGASGAAASGPPTATLAASHAPTPVVLPPGVTAELLIPAIHLDQFVLEGTTDADLQRGPGHYVGTPEPGHAGNVAIAGHRTTYGAPFNRLGDLRAGDSIEARTAGGDFLYIVTSERSVSPSQTSVIDDYGDNRMTLTTCTPEFFATQRLVVTAALIGPTQLGATPAPHLGPAPTLSTAPKSTNTAAIAALKAGSRGFDLGAMPLALLVGGALVGLALLYERVRKRLSVWGAVAILGPLWFCGLVLLFQRLTIFLPPYI